MIDAKTALKENSSKYKVTSKLDSAMSIAKRLTHSDEIYELPYVSADQLFAIFGSLLLPLLAPIIKNVYCYVVYFFYNIIKIKRLRILFARIFLLGVIIILVRCSTCISKTKI